MYGTLSEDIELKVPASKGWSIYGTLELVKLLAGKVFEAVEVIEGDSGTGTIIKVISKTDAGIFHHKEKSTKVDNQNMVKESEVVEGGILDLDRVQLL
nr:S-norcoclaurine synthase 2-like [Tanacetum cinerariifolium]